MTIQNTLIDYRVDMSADILQLPDVVGLRYYNDGRDELIQAIIEEKESYFYNYITSNTVIGQNEYQLTKRGDIAQDGVTILDGVQKIQGVSVFLKSTDTFMTKLEQLNVENLPKDIESYAKTAKPFYLVQDNSIFIYPTPIAVLSYRIYGIMLPKRLSLNSTDTLPDQYIKSILWYVQKRYFESLRLFNEATLMEQKFEQEKINVGKAVSGRVQAPVRRTLPNSINLKRYGSTNAFN